MANPPSNAQSREFARLLAEYEPEIRRGFMASVTDLQANVDWVLLLAELERGDVNAAVLALNIDESAWVTYSASVSSAYAASGASTVAIIRQTGIAPIGIRFNMSNPRAEAWIRENVANRVTYFTQEQINVARSVILNGYAAGEGAETIGLDLVGRVGANRVREGGVLGLDAPRAERLHKVAQGMRTAEGVRSLVIEHADGSVSLKYKVNPATANRILVAYRAGTEVPEAQRIVSERQYQNALLKARGDTVAQTETANAVLGARDEEWRQVMESQGIPRDRLIKTWRHGRGATTHHRPDHLAMAGTRVRGIDTPFVFPDGTRMLHPHDPAGGARHVINCGCMADYTIDRAGFI